MPSGAASSSSAANRPVAEDLPEDVAAQVHDNLEAIRATMAHGNLETHTFFQLKALGGQWSIKQGKKLTTDFQSIAKDKSVAEWCSLTHFPARKSFSTNAYGHESARRLAEEVVRRGDFFYGSWIDAGSPIPFDFNPLVADYTVADEF